MQQQVGKLTSSSVRSQAVEGQIDDSFFNVTMSIGGVKVIATVDTGSQVTTILVWKLNHQCPGQLLIL